jgi:hypothetical protein
MGDMFRLIFYVILRPFFVVIQIATTETSPTQSFAAYQAQRVTYILYNFK